MGSIERIAVLGAGAMGAGIAELCASRGLGVQLHDVRSDVALAGKKAIQERLSRRVERGALARGEADGIDRRLTCAASLEAAVQGADFIIEAVPEHMSLKVQVLTAAAAVGPKGAVLASNTSSLSITELGAQVGEGSRVVGLHFFNPPPVMPLVEIVRGWSTAKDVLQRATELVAILDKEAITVEDSPGFATSRLGVILGAEAIRMLESGVAGVRDLDRALELGYRHPMGPLKLTDLVGLDVRLAILEHLTREIGEQFRPPPLLRKLVRAGMLGKKTGAGFYVWGEQGPVPNPELGR